MAVSPSMRARANWFQSHGGPAKDHGPQHSPARKAPTFPRETVSHHVGPNGRGSGGIAQQCGNFVESKEVVT
jgi:hypothetical protein